MTLTLTRTSHVSDGRCQDAVALDRFEALDALQQVKERGFGVSHATGSTRSLVLTHRPRSSLLQSQSRTGEGRRASLILRRRALALVRVVT
jgi:hypothetical protein